MDLFWLLVTSFFFFFTTKMSSYFLGCGPTSLNALVREVVSNQINPHGQDQDGRGHVALISEEFEY